VVPSSRTPVHGAIADAVHDETAVYPWHELVLSES
jgi:hypothetical protein